jgi:hypothetical protein
MLSQDIAAVVRAFSLVVAFCSERLMETVSHALVAWLLYASRHLTRRVRGPNRVETPQLSHNGTVQ